MNIQNFFQRKDSNKIIITKNELYYQEILESRTGCGHKRIPHVGTTDITTLDTHIEIKIWHKYSDALGQLRKYNRAEKRKHLHVYLFGKEPTDKRIDFIEDFFTKEGITMFSFTAEDSIIQHNFLTKFLEFSSESFFGGKCPPSSRYKNKILVKDKLDSGKAVNYVMDSAQLIAKIPLLYF